MDTPDGRRSHAPRIRFTRQQRSVALKTLIEVLLVLTLLMNPFTGVVLALESFETTGTEGLAVLDPTLEPEGEPLSTPIEIVPTALGDTWTVTFNAGTQAVGGNVVRSNVADGTLLVDITPVMTPKPGYVFSGWSPAGGTPAYNGSTPVTQDMTYTALYTAQVLGGKYTRDWPAALAIMGWSPPANAMRLLFDDVSINGHTILDYVYLVIDESGNATLYFLCASNNKQFEVAGSYMNYAGITGTVVGRYDSMVPGNLKMYRVFKVDIPASMIASTIINGTPEVNVVNESSPSHSIWGKQLKFTNISYVTEHWLYDGLDGAIKPLNLRLRATIPGVADSGTFVTARPITIPGYDLVTIDYPSWDSYPAMGKTIASGTVPSGGIRLTLRLYYLHDESFTWTIKGLLGDAATTVYNGQEQKLSDLLSPGTQFYEIEWPNDGNLYQFVPAPSGDGTGVVLANPGGINVGTYQQSLELLDGYKVLYRPKNPPEGSAWKPDPTVFAPEHIVQDADGLWWADIHDEMGPAVVIQGELTIIERPLTITTASAEKKWDGTALTKPTPTAVSLRDTTDPNETDINERFGWNGLLADLTPAHRIEYTVTGTITDVGETDNTFSVQRIYYVDPITSVQHDVTANYRVVADTGTLTVHPIVRYEANWPTGPGTQLGSAPMDTNGNAPAPGGENGYRQGSTVTVLGNSGAGALVKLGYTFIGWARSATASTPDFPVDDAGAIVGPAGFAIDDNVTLYGVWARKAPRQVTYTVTGPALPTVSNMPTTPQNYYEGDPVTVSGIPTTTSTVNGTGELGTWTFIGWDTTDVTPVDGAFTMPDRNVAFTGTWQFTRNADYTVSYVVDHVAYDFPTPENGYPIATTSHQWGSTVTREPIPTTTSLVNGALVGQWAFSGWYMQSGDVVIASDGTFTMPQENVVFEGHWVFTPEGYHNVIYRVEDPGPAPTTISGLPTTPQPHQHTTTVTVAGTPTTSATSRGDELGTWEFVGWTLETAGVTIGSGNTFVMPDFDVTFRGEWRFTPHQSYQVTYTVTSTNNPATFAGMPTTPQMYQWGKAVNVAGGLTTTETTRGSELGTWTFIGWDSEDVTPVDGAFTMPERNVAFTGVWQFTPNASYRVVYEITGPDKPSPVSGMPGRPHAHQWGSIVTVAADPTTTSTSRGTEIGTWTFSGWRTRTPGVTVGTDGTFVMPESTVVFTGHWTFTPNPYFDVTYSVVDIRPATESGMPTTPQAHQRDATVTVAGPLTTTETTKDGYLGTWQFHGWAVASGGVTPSGGTFIMPDNDVALTGYWTFTPVPIHTITYNGNGNTAGSVPIETRGNALSGNRFYTGSTVEVLGKGTLVKEGYTFIGWATSQADAIAGTVTYDPLDTFTITEDVVLYAVWEINLWAISYAYNGFVPSSAPTLGAGYQRSGVAYGTDQTVAPNPSVAGYTFRGWTTADATVDGSGTFTMPDCNVAFVGSWSAQPLNIIYIYVGADEYDAQNIPCVSADKVTTGTYDEIISHAPDPDPYLTGYAFEGWYVLPLTFSPILRGVLDGDPWIFGSGGTTLCTENGVVCAETNTLTLYAHWRANEYTIHFDPNGGVGSAPDWHGSIGDTVVLPNSAFTRQLYTLLGFDPTASSATAGLTGPSFVLTADMIDLLFTPLETPERTEATLYAIWKKNPPSPTKPVVGTPKTGDTSAVVQWLSVVGISSSALVASAILGRRRKRDELI